MKIGHNESRMNDPVNYKHFPLFTVLFGALYFLLFIFTENFSILWVTPFFLLLYALMFLILCWKSKEKIAQPIWFTIISLATLLSIFLILTPLAATIPEAVFRWVTLAVAGLSAFLFLGTPIIDRSQQKFTDTLIFIHALFLPLNFIIFFNDTLKSLAPTGSILNFTLGQNHVYILYLIALPLCINHLKKPLKPIQTLSWIILSIAFALGTIFAFSRVGILLLVVELLYLLLTNSKSFTLQIKRIIWLLCIGVALSFIAFISFTLIPSVSFGIHCKSPVFQAQLCKSFSADSRTDYWLQALQGVEAMPLIGNGGGSFSYISLRYRQTMAEYSAYPHNEYIQLVAEFGIFGLIFCLGYLGSLAFSWKHFSRLNDHTKLLLFISSVLATDSFFNFNWSFPGILLAEVVIWAVMFRQVLRTILVRKSGTSSKLFVLPLAAVTLPLLWLSVTFVFAELTSKGSVERYVSTFPYISWKARQTLLSPETSRSIRIQTEELYKNDESVMRISAEQQINPQKQFDAYQRLKLLDPLNPQVRVKILILATKVNQPNVVLEELQWLTHYYKQEELYIIRDIEPAYMDRLISYANQLANVDPELALEITMLSYRFEPWKVNHVKTNFLITPSEYSDDQVVKLMDSLSPYVLWSYLDSPPPNVFWSYLNSLNVWTWDKMTAAADASDWENLQLYSRLMVQYSDGYPQVQWDHLSQIFEIKLESAPAYTPDGLAERAIILRAWRTNLETIQKFGKVRDITLDTSDWVNRINRAEK